MEKMIFTDYGKVLVLNFLVVGNPVFLWVEKLMERWYLLVTVKFLVWTFRWWEIRSFFQPISWWKDDIYLVFFTFPWYSRIWEIRFFVQCSPGNLLTEVSLNTDVFHEKYDIKTSSPFLCFFATPPAWTWWKSFLRITGGANY